MSAELPQGISVTRGQRLDGLPGVCVVFSRPEVGSAAIVLTPRQARALAIVLWDEAAAASAATAAAGNQGSSRSCRECGCTEARACPGGCCWVEDDLCSACAEVRR